MRVARLIALAAGAAVLVAAAYLVITVAEDAAFDARYVPALQHDLGFRSGSPLVRAGAARTEVMTLYPDGAGLMARAGVRGGDIVPDVRSTTEFYRSLQAGRGGQVRFSVIDGGDGLPLDKRATRTVTLRVPVAMR